MKVLYKHRQGRNPLAEPEKSFSSKYQDMNIVAGAGAQAHAISSLRAKAKTRKATMRKALCAMVLRAKPC